ncbi:hypothetical protein yc1106_08780 [Curvularia clavata]|uniref:Uncharacterized protein n=1 Tax=Curvularia clavata TaxID=95742 RepID=A0A9Q8ZDX3_CURCL|nr:hypothetical protein yc1106_08780 [Curvularia clavata]
MSQLTQAKIKSHLQDAASSKFSKDKYGNLLGFYSTSKSKQGRPTYQGKVREFNDAASNIAHELLRKYGSLNELQNEIKTQERFTESLIEDMIKQYGPAIWNDNESQFVTATVNKGDGESDYPRHLIYSNESDRIWIRTFAYCFTLKSAWHKMRSTGFQPRDDTTIPSEFSHTAPRGSRVRGSTINVRNPDAAPVEPTRTLPTTPTSSNTSENGYLQEYQVPVAQMLPTENVEGISLSSTMPPSNTAGPSVAASNDFNATEDHCRPIEMSHSRSLRKAVSSREEMDECLPLRKRKRSLYGGAADASFQSLQLSEFTGRSVRPRKGLTYNISRSTSPDVTLEDPDNSADQRPRSIFRNRTTVHDAIETASVRYQSRCDTDANDDSDNDAVVATSVTISHIHTTNANMHIPGGGIGEFDSVMGSPQPSPTIEEQDSDDEPTLIVKLKVKSQKEIRQRKLYRKYLASKLLSAFEMSSEQLKVLEDVVKLIKGIRDLDAPLLQSGRGGRNVPYQLVLDQWLRLVNIYLRFRNNPNFNYDPSTWAVHRRSLESAERIRKDQIINTARAEMMEWSFEHDKYDTNEWSRCATAILLEMADWGFELNAEDVEEIRGRFVKFNKSLLEG